MTVRDTTAGEYVTRKHPITQVGTYTGVPARSHGTYISGTSADGGAGRYTQSSLRPTHGRTATGNIRLTSGILAHH